jgi:hypothetical protein
MMMMMMMMMIGRREWVVVGAGSVWSLVGGSVESLMRHE